MKRKDQGFDLKAFLAGPGKEAVVALLGAAEIVGTTRSRVSFFMNRFRKLGFIQYSGKYDSGLKVHSSLLNVILHDRRQPVSNSEQTELG